MANLPGLIEEFRATAGTTRQSAEAIDQELRRADGSVAAMLGCWEGNARRIFEAEWQSMVLEVQRCLEELHDLAAGLDHEATEIETAIITFG